MRMLVGILCSILWLLYLGQLTTVVNLKMAQRLGLQERPSNVNRLHIGLEVWSARWDLLWLWVLPVAGILILIDHPWWPYAAMIGGGATVDTGGREAAKAFGLRQQGIRTGSAAERRLAWGVFGYMILVGGLALTLGLAEVTR